MNSKYIIPILISSFSVLIFSGCTLVSLRTPFVDIQKLGTVVKADENIRIQNANGTVTVEYVAPTKRRITWEGESREILLFKSSLLNGIYNEHAKLRPSPIGQIKDVEYEESTAVLKSQEDVNDLIKTYMEYGYEHRVEEQMFVHLEVRKYFNFGIKSWHPKYLVVLILKYEVNENNGQSFLAKK